MAARVVADGDTVVVVDGGRSRVAIRQTNQVAVVNDRSLPGPIGPAGPSPSVSVYDEASPTIADGLLTLDAAAATTFFVTLDQDVTAVAVANLPPSGRTQRIALYLEQDSVGGHTVAGWPDGTKWSQGLPYVATLEAGSVDCVLLDMLYGGRTFANIVGIAYS